MSRIGGTRTWPKPLGVRTSSWRRPREYQDQEELFKKMDESAPPGPPRAPGGPKGGAQKFFPFFNQLLPTLTPSPKFSSCH